MAGTSRLAPRVAVVALLAATAGALMQGVTGDVSDWIARLHGAAPDGAKAPPPADLAGVSVAPGVAADPQVESFLQALARAVKARDGTLLDARLAADYAVDGLPSGARAAQFMAKAIERMRGPRQIVIESVATAGALRTVRARFEYVGQDAAVKTFVLDPAGNLLRSDLFRLAHP